MEGEFTIAPNVLPPPPLPDGSPAPPRSAERHNNLVRFQSELEFVQCLANPLYLYELHMQKYFSDDAFLTYLEYLQYWHEPDYVRFITYPTSLVYLSLLLKPAFREAIANPGYISELMRVGARHHETWRVGKGPNGSGQPISSAPQAEGIPIGSAQTAATAAEADVAPSANGISAPDQAIPASSGQTQPKTEI